MYQSSLRKGSYFQHNEYPSHYPYKKRGTNGTLSTRKTTMTLIQPSQGCFRAT